MSGIIFLCLFYIGHFSPTVFCCNGEAISTRFRIRTSHRKIETYDESYCQDASISVSLVKKHYGNQDPWKSVAGEDRSGRPGKETDLFEASAHDYHEQFMESFCKGNVSCTSYSRTFYDTQMATANCVHPHAQLEHA